MSLTRVAVTIRRVGMAVARVKVIMWRVRSIVTRRKICVAWLIMMQHGWQLKYGAVLSLIDVSESLIDVSESLCDGWE